MGIGFKEEFGFHLDPGRNSVLIRKSKKLLKSKKMAKDRKCKEIQNMTEFDQFFFNPKQEDWMREVLAFCGKILIRPLFANKKNSHQFPKKSQFYFKSVQSNAEFQQSQKNFHTPLDGVRLFFSVKWSHSIEMRNSINFCSIRLKNFSQKNRGRVCWHRLCIDLN